nr:VWA domain-containing protein [Lachnospiraceae bacterium]
TMEVGDEVYVDNLTVPDTIRIGDQYAITVTIISNVETEAKLSLFSGRTLKGEEQVRLNAGENQFVFYDTADENGFRSYRVEVQAAKDTMTVNNEYSAFAQIESKARILVVEGVKGEALGLSGALDAAGVSYDVVTPTGAPTSINQMMEYKSIILLNVYYDDLKPGFTGNIESYVKDYAGGLIAIGGDNSFALGGYRDTPLETVLPVNMDLEGERQIPKMEIVMVIDHSGSMSDTASDGSGITSLDLAKAAAVKALETLRKTDSIGVMAFDDFYTWVVEPQTAEDTEAIAAKIGSIEIGGGTMIYPAVEAAAKKLATSDAQIKHIILLTDGQDTYNNYDALCEVINDAGITVSSVAVGQGANVHLLQSLAEKCGGRYYYTDISQGLPRIFAKEVYLSAKEYLINEEFTPVIVNQNEILDVLSDGVPSLSGYIASTAKPTATQLLVSHKDDPVLTVWQYGLGKAVAWNSDATGAWTRYWAAWEGYPQFWKNLIDYTITDTGLGEDKMEVVQEGSHATVTYTTGDFDSDTKVSAVCTDEKGNTTELSFDPLSPGVYQAYLDTDEVGVYNIALKNEAGDKVVKSVNTATAMQYSAEYRFSGQIDSLSRLTVLCGGREITTEDEIFLPIEQAIRAKYNIGNILLLLALCIFMLDVIERRLNIELLAPIFRRLAKRRQARLAEVGAAPAYMQSVEQQTVPDDAQSAKPAKNKAERRPDKKAQDVKETQAAKKAQGSEETKAAKRAMRTKKKSGTQQKKEGPKTLDTNTLLKKQQERNQ